LPAAELERFIVDQIKTIGKDVSVLQDCIEKTQAQMQDKIQELKGIRDEKQQHIQELSQEIGKVAPQVGFDETAAGRIESCQQQIKDIQAEVATVNSEIVSIQKQMLNPDELVGTLESFEPLWDSMKPKQKEKLIHLLIKQVEWDSETDNIFIAFHQTNIEVFN